MEDGQTPSEGTIRYLTIADILASADLEEQDVFVPEWGGTVHVRGLTKGRQQELRGQAAVQGEVDTDRLEVFLFIEGVVDPATKEPLFSAEHYEQLRGKSAVAMDRVLKAVTGLSGMSQGDPASKEPSSIEEATRTFPS